MELVSIITPTFPGREDVLKRCITSVHAQEFRGSIEHIIVSDRTDNWLSRPRYWTAYKDRWERIIHVVHLNESWRNPINEASIGAIPWQVGSLLARGSFVGFVGDDDELLPDHVQRHVETLKANEADFSISQVEFKAHGESKFVVGDDSFQLGHLDADGLMCRVSALSVANWSASVDPPGVAADWRLVQDWLAGGLKVAMVPGGPTAVHHDGWLIGKTGRPDRPR